MPRINAARWRLLSAYLEEALEVAPDQRASWLASICVVEPSLGEDLRQMLAEHDVVSLSRFLERPLLDARTVNRACHFPSNGSDSGSRQSD